MNRIASVRTETVTKIDSNIIYHAAILMQCSVNMHELTQTTNELYLQVTGCITYSIGVKENENSPVCLPADSNKLKAVHIF